MYHLYRVTGSGGDTRFVREREAHLFGCNVGTIPNLLAAQLPPIQDEPYEWHVDVDAAMAAENLAFVIDLKPNNKDKAGSMSLYQIRDAWGLSSAGWTPAMLRLRGLVVDGEPEIADPEDFTVKLPAENESIYTFVHFNGTVRDGALHGPWTPPSRSSTNSALLWPESLRYFVGCIRTTTPELA